MEQNRIFGIYTDKKIHLIFLIFFFSLNSIFSQDTLTCFTNKSSVLYLKKDSSVIYINHLYTNNILGMGNYIIKKKELIATFNTEPNDSSFYKIDSSKSSSNTNIIINKVNNGDCCCLNYSLISASGALFNKQNDSAIFIIRNLEEFKDITYLQINYGNGSEILNIPIKWKTTTYYNVHISPKVNILQDTFIFKIKKEKLILLNHKKYYFIRSKIFKPCKRNSFYVNELKSRIH